MKKIFYLVLVALLVGNVAVVAQENVKRKVKTVDEKVLQRIHRIEKSVGALTEVERTKLTTFFTEQENERTQRQISNQKIRQANRSECDAEIKKILGSERFDKLDKDRTQRQESRKMRSPNSKRGKGKRNQMNMSNHTVQPQ